MNQTLTTIYTTPEEAAQFIDWKKHEKMYHRLWDKGVFEVKNASVELFFDGMGHLRKVKIHREI